ncbi:MAG TPA: hypothetical protein VEV17_18610 [Bryobacteraceae bacterium]|nr:hypothetical protein [Bryobacteraceae bacterium]
MQQNLKSIPGRRFFVCVLDDATGKPIGWDLTLWRAELLAVQQYIRQLRRRRERKVAA